MTNKQVNFESMTPLQPDYLRIVRLIGLLFCLLISVAFSIVGAAIILSLAWYYALLVFGFLFGVLVGLLSWYFKHWYQAYRYQLNDERLAIKRGVFWQHHISVPISRVQHVDVNSGPLDRRYNLAKLVVNTAGTHHAQTSLPGLSLTEAHALRDQLLLAQQGDTV